MSVRANARWGELSCALRAIGAKEQEGNILEVFHDGETLHKVNANPREHALVQKHEVGFTHAEVFPCRLPVRSEENTTVHPLGKRLTQVESSSKVILDQQERL